jgi:hypothetical protein
VITVLKTGYDETEKIVEVAARGSAKVAIELAPSSFNSGNRYAIVGRTRIPFYVLGGLAVLAGSAGGMLYTAAAAKGSAADDLLGELKRCSSTTPGCTTLLDLRQSHDTLANAGTGVLIGGAAFLGAAVLYGVYAFSAPAPSGTGSITILPAASPAGGSLSVRGTF